MKLGKKPNIANKQFFVAHTTLKALAKMVK